MEQKSYQKGKKYPHLFQPLRIGNIRLKNRIIAAPTSPSMISTEGHFTHEIIAYLEEKALGGAAVVTHGEAIVHSRTGKSHNKQLQLDSFGVKQTLTQAARAIHNAGAYANIQLSHGGKYGGLASVGGDQDRCETAYGPSHEITPAGEVLEMPKELILEIIESYRNAARLCKDCGFDMVMVHAAHGWLFSQFLSPVQNRRVDEFGGSLENRVRFLLMALDAVRDGVGPHFPIEIRLSGDDMTENGLHLEDCIRVAQMVDDKVDLFNISAGDHEDPTLFCRTHPSAFYPHGANVYLAAEIKKHVKKPVACIGSLNDPGQMEEIIATGKADIVELARALLADPYLPQKALKGQADDITPCLRCFECFGETTKTEHIRCTVNPRMGQQLWEKFPRKTPEQKKKILIAGGGPAGMEAAIIAAERGHDVTLVEKSGQLGGNLLPAGAPYFKQDIVEFLTVLIRRVNNAGIKIFLNTEVTEDYLKNFSPDVLFVAIGSSEIIPPIKGIDGDNVITAINAELHPEKLGKQVAIIGGGLVGAEAAVSFNRDGKECTIIEMKNEIAEEVNPMYRGGLMPEVQKAAKIYTNTTVKEILPQGILCNGDKGEFIVDADTIVVAAGFKPLNDAVDRLCNSAKEYHILGDCKNVGQIYHAINAAYYAALSV
jgi:2,4-dienoyl-CoA reductase-like NADH-dependent reductase (Old Yellow Enzyme family)/thioredoxin reductase